jgi:hypothetical protein
MAAALQLRKAGVEVELWEARSRLGGRAGSFVDQSTGHTVDYCQHVGMGCCTHLLQFLDETKTLKDWRRHRRLHFFGPKGQHVPLQASRFLPAPLHLQQLLWKWPGLTWGQRWEVARAVWRLIRLTPNQELDSRSALAFLVEAKQSAGAIERFWATIMVSALGESLDQVALGPRITGTAPNQQLGEQVLSHLTTHGWLTRTQNFVYKNTPARNLIGVKGAQNKDIVIIGAHYDTRRKADQDPQYPNQPVPGANDGASGVAVLMELARTLEINRIDKQVWLVFFDAEDNGDLDGWEWIVGSQQFAASLTISPTAVIIIDMIGDADQEIWLERSSNLALSTELWEVAHKLGYEQYFRKLPRWSMLDDHTPFLQRGWKAIDIIDFDYAHWHKTSDTPDKVSAQSLLHVGRTLEAWLEK